MVKGEGPVAKERMKARRDAWESNAWVREAAAAYAAKRAKRKRRDLLAPAKAGPALRGQRSQPSLG